MNPQWICLRLTALELHFQTVYESSLMFPFFILFFLNHFQFPGNHAEPFVAVSWKLSHQAANDNSKKKKLFAKTELLLNSRQLHLFQLFLFSPPFLMITSWQSWRQNCIWNHIDIRSRKDCVFIWALHLWALRVGHAGKVKDQNLNLMVFQGFWLY